MSNQLPMSVHSTPLHSTPLHSTPLHSTPLHSTPLHSFVFFSFEFIHSISQSMTVSHGVGHDCVAKQDAMAGNAVCPSETCLNLHFLSESVLVSFQHRFDPVLFQIIFQIRSDPIRSDPIRSDPDIVQSLDRSFLRWLDMLEQVDSIQFDSIRFNSIQFDSIRFNSIQFDSIRLVSIHFISSRLVWSACRFWSRNAVSGQIWAVHPFSFSFPTPVRVESI